MVRAPSLTLSAAWMSGFAILVVGLLSLVGCSRPATAAPGPASSGEAPVQVRSVPVVAEEVTRPVRASGVLAAKQELRLSFKLGGIVRQVAVDEGRSVTRGQVLAALDPSEIGPQVAQAREARDKAARDLERAKQLHEAQVATRAQLQDATTAFEVADAAWSAAAFNQRQATLVAPSNGRILRRLVEPGEVVSPGQALFQFASADGGWVVRVGLTDRDVVRVREGDAAEVSLDAYPGRTFQARVSEIASAATPGLGTAEVELELRLPKEVPARVAGADERGGAEPSPRLLSGLSAKARVLPSERQTVRFIPVEALLEGDGDVASVFIVNPDGRSARRQRVRVAFLSSEDGRAALSEGPDVGAHVVTDGVAFLRDGQAVAVVEAR
ncbi:efflux RND transporter periplasmic adaptor subunit [Myxococcus sp. CA051A]|uniref:efflux RND transporter periplasmic adaptor subunit n=1 Tax=unclassified Myxococcus TaxID=2648731 RepID=UPI00157AB896|nr:MULTISPECIES: efflux RND transporter periplasmic adaptor subunit [unclassified Myxococcus]NTX15702.1 efflux RND transporter periplasmic adaptor subunit [Myxococcus sp. CA056]NTX38328.1 efflux RND transporter periplasmic adaptor subunit [Myxococcus sp. CA033]NTX53198.1 efflux RND transporter periplasmic adaptor subunit [Myxococcus sp. CA039A]NTX65429.1 efflux RND transporter periplasmic adaptor subunit [Myxococcus sp. CA051A]